MRGGSSILAQAIQAQALTIVGQPPRRKIHHGNGRETTAAGQQEHQQDLVFDRLQRIEADPMRSPDPLPISHQGAAGAGAGSTTAPIKLSSVDIKSAPNAATNLPPSVATSGGTANAQNANATVHAISFHHGH